MFWNFETYNRARKANECCSGSNAPTTWSIFVAFCSNWSVFLFNNSESCWLFLSAHNVFIAQIKSSILNFGTSYEKVPKAFYPGSRQVARILFYFVKNSSPGNYKLPRKTFIEIFCVSFSVDHYIHVVFNPEYQKCVYIIIFPSLLRPINFTNIFNVEARSSRGNTPGTKPYKHFFWKKQKSEKTTWKFSKKHWKLILNCTLMCQRKVL